MLNAIKEYVISLGADYGVDPVIFAGIYLGAIPFFSMSLGWLVRNYKQEKPIILPVISSLFFFLSSYLYLIIAGKNVPWWVYVIIFGMIAVGAFTTIRKIRGKLREEAS